MKGTLTTSLFLVTCALPAQLEQPASGELLGQIEREYRELHNQWLVRVRSGNAGLVAPSKMFVDRCHFLAKENAGKDEAVPFLVWIVRNATDEGSSAGFAIDTLLSDHARSPAWVEVLDVLLGTERLVGAAHVEAVLARVTKENAHSEVLARARFAIGLRSLAAAQDQKGRDAAFAKLKDGLQLSKDPVFRTDVEGALAAAQQGIPRVVVDDHETAVRVAAREGKLILVNFSGFTCPMCRCMEWDVFKRPAVAEELAKSFVESRIHVDVREKLTKERLASNRELRDLLAGSMAMPTYVIVDPRSGRPVRAHGLKDGPEKWEPRFVDFLKGNEK